MMYDEAIQEANKGQDAFALGTVVSVVNNKVTVRLDGQSSASAKAYKRITTGATLSAGYRVLLARVSGTYIVIGRVNNT